MQRMLIAAAAFVVSATLGVGLLALVIVASILLSRHNSSGIGSVAGGVNHLTVLLVPLACGTAGAILALRRIRRSRP